MQEYHRAWRRKNRDRVADTQRKRRANREAERQAYPRALWAERERIWKTAKRAMTQTEVALFRKGWELGWATDTTGPNPPAES